MSAVNLSSRPLVTPSYEEVGQAGSESPGQNMSLPPAIRSELPKAAQDANSTPWPENSSRPSGKDALVARHTSDKAAQFVKNQSAAASADEVSPGETAPQTAGDRFRAAQADAVVETIERFKVDNPVGGLSQQLLDQSANAKNGLEKGAGYVLAYGIGMPLEMITGAGTMAVNFPANAAQAGVHAAATLHADTAEAKGDHAVDALQHGLQAASGAVIIGGVAGKLVLGRSLAAKTTAASGEQAARAFSDSDKEGDGRLKDAGIGAISGATGALVSGLSHGSIGGVASQAVGDALSGKDLKVSTMMRAASGANTTGPLLDSLGSTTVSSNLAQQVTLRP